MKYSSVRYCEREKKVKCRAGGGGGHESVHFRNRESP